MLRGEGHFTAVVPVRILKCERIRKVLWPWLPIPVSSWRCLVQVEDGEGREPKWVEEGDILNVNVNVRID